MASFPIIVNFNSVEITTNSSSLTYSMLLNSLNWTAFKVQSLYLQASTNDQVSTNFTLTKTNKTGQEYITNMSGALDQYQFLPVLMLGIEKANQFIIDNLTTMGFDLLPQEYIEMQFYTLAVTPEELLFEDQQDLKIAFEQKEVKIKTEIDKRKKYITGCAVIGSLAAVALIITLLKNKNE